MYGNTKLEIILTLCLWKVQIDRKGAIPPDRIDGIPKPKTGVHPHIGGPPTSRTRSTPPRQDKWYPSQHWMDKALFTRSICICVCINICIKFCIESMVTQSEPCLCVCHQHNVKCWSWCTCAPHTGSNPDNHTTLRQKLFGENTACYQPRFPICDSLVSEWTEYN